METPLTVPCPVCQRPAEFSPCNRYRPFCSERCKNVDLGAWASEQFRLPVQTPVDTPPDDDGAAPGH